MTFALVPLPGLAVSKNKVAAPGPPAGVRPLAIIGYASSGDIAVPGPYTSLKTLQTDLAKGSLVEAAAFALSPYGGVGTIQVVNAGGANAGSYGTITTDFADASAPTIAGDSTTLPEDTLEVRVRFKTDGEVKTDGIRYDFTTDNGFSYFGERALGTSTYIDLPFGAGKYSLNPPADALVALATEIRADSLAHFANAVAHNSADATSAALITLGVPATNAQAWAVLNQCRLAWISHLLNATAHDSADVVDAIEAPAATDSQSGITLGLDLKGKINPHLLATAAASPAGLHAALATTVAPQTVAAVDMIAGGITSLNSYPRAITFTTAGGTAADAPATVNITGFDVAGAAQTETGLVISQTAAMVTSTKKWRGTGLSVTYAAADGTGATIAIGLTAAVHNSADATNTITGDDPERGTVTAGDEFYLETTGPFPDVPQLVAAIRALRAYALDFGVILFSDPMSGAALNTVVAEIEALWGFAKFRSTLIAFRLPGAGETYLQYKVAAAASFGAYSTTEARVVGGGVRAYSPLQITSTGYARPLRPPAWWVACARARSQPETCLQSLPAAAGVELKDSKGNTLPRCFDEQETVWSVEVRMVGMRTNPQKNPIGVYVNQDILLFDVDSPWILGPYTDVDNHLTETIQAFLVSTLGEGYPSPPGVPFSEEIRHGLERNAQSIAEQEGPRKKRCTQIVIRLAADAGLNGRVDWEGTMIPLNYNVNGGSLVMSLSALPIGGTVTT